MNPREAFERQAAIARGMSNQRMSQVVKDSLAQQFNLGNPQEQEDIFKINKKQTHSAPAIKIEISGSMLNDAMTKPQTRRNKPSINIQIG